MVTHELLVTADSHLERLVLTDGLLVLSIYTVMDGTDFIISSTRDVRRKAEGLVAFWLTDVQAQEIGHLED